VQDEKLRLRLHGPASEPALIHLPGLHGDWTLLAPFRHALNSQARFVETTYPHRPDWSLDDYAAAMESALIEHHVTSGWILGESFSSQVAWGVRLAHAASKRISVPFLRRICQFYTRTMTTRFRDCAGAAEEFAQFVENRANESDRNVITHRYRLIVENQPAAIARETRLPVYHLSGAWDPIVPWWHVRPWLRRNCPGYRGTRIIWSGDHNILLSAPQQSAEQILAWVRAADPSTTR
jgi:pimeloyl-ACP methyl ester carboxylesterase